MRLCFIISSVIYFPSKPLSYIKTRSLFSALDRAKQTLETIRSIRSRFKDVKIILVESGLKRDLPYDLDKYADAYVYLGENHIVRWACDSKHKGLGEAISLIYAKKYIVNQSDFYFKISGRYFLTDNFNLNSWNNKCFNVKKYEQNISTRLYGFPCSSLKTWHSFLKKSIIYLVRGKSLEDSITKFLPKNTNFIERIGVAGYVGIDGSFIDE